MDGKYNFGDLKKTMLQYFEISKNTIDKKMVIGNIFLKEKDGGKSGHIIN